MTGITLTEEEARAYALALARGTGTVDVKDMELRRAMEAGCEFKVHGEIHRAIMSGEVDVAFKQRGIGTMILMPRQR